MLAKPYSISFASFTAFSHPTTFIIRNTGSKFSYRQTHITGNIATKTVGPIYAFGTKGGSKEGWAPPAKTWAPSNTVSWTMLDTF